MWGSEWNISSGTGWIAMDYHHVSMHCNYFGDPLTFIVAPPTG